MLIMTQNRKCLFNLERAGTLFLSSYYGDYEEGKPVKVMASLPLAEDVTEDLGVYESEARAMEVLGEIARSYGEGAEIDGTIHPEYGYVNCRTVPNRKVYQMPER
mgnify:CR=1 FL=1